MSIFSDISKVVGKIVVPAALANSLAQVSLADERKAFIAVLVATASHASAKPNFNLELEMNDLWIRLQNLKTATGGQGSASGSLSRILTTLSDVQFNLGNTLKALVGNMRP